MRRLNSGVDVIDYLAADLTGVTAADARKSFQTVRVEVVDAAALYETACDRSHRRIGLISRCPDLFFRQPPDGITHQGEANPPLTVGLGDQHQLDEALVKKL